MKFFEFEIFRDFKNILQHAVLTKHANLVNFKSKTQPIFFKNQLHGTKIFSLKKPQFNLEGDVLMTNLKQIPLGIRIADCASIMIFDPIKRAIANIHAGWRGLSQRIIQKAVQELSRRFSCKPKNLLVGISPMLGVCCSIFSDPSRELPKFLHQYITEENHVNLWAIAEGHLRECGVKQGNIENPRICTFCNPENFHSFRRDKTDSRFCTIIMLK